MSQSRYKLLPSPLPSTEKKTHICASAISIEGNSIQKFCSCSGSNSSRVVIVVVVAAAEAVAVVVVVTIVVVDY